MGIQDLKFTDSVSPSFSESGQSMAGDIALTAGAWAESALVLPLSMANMKQALFKGDF